MSMPNYSSSGASMMGGLQNSMADVTSSIGFWSNSGTGTGLQSFAGMGDAGALGGYQGVGVGNPMDSAAAAAATSMLGLTYATAGMVNPQGADAMMGATEEQKVSMMLMMSNGGAMGDGTTQGDGMNGGINPAANRALVGGQQPPLPPNPAGEKSGRKKGKNKKADDPALPPPPPPPDSAAANALMFNMMAAAAVSGGGADPLGFAAGMVPGFDASAMSNIPMPPPLMGSSDGGESGRAGGSSRSGRSGRRSPNFNSSTSGSYRRVARSSRPSDNDHKRNNNGDTKKADSGGGEDMEGVEGPDITGTDDLAEGVIKFRNATVYPPPPNFTAPLRERPASCRTIFVGGVPEKCTEDILREVFENCGEIQTCRVRASKGFAHIRFLLHEAVDRAMYFTGYRLAVNNKMDKEHSNRLHIDYAKDRDDVLEWETQQKALRDVRAAAVTTITIPTPTMPSRVDAPSPPKSVRYSEREASSLLEQLKQPETFTPSTSVLQTWLDRGDCSKRTCAQFYSMIGAVNAHIRRLTGERESAQSEMNAFREKHKLVLQIIMSQLQLIKGIFTAARKQRNWDHFSKPQRKNLETWIKQIEDLCQEHEGLMLHERHEEEMEVASDEDDEGGSQEKEEPLSKRPKTEAASSEAQAKTLADAEITVRMVTQENDALKVRLEALQKDLIKLKMDNHMQERKEQARARDAEDDQGDSKHEVESLRAELETVNGELVDVKDKLKGKSDEVRELKKTQSSSGKDVKVKTEMKPDSSNQAFQSRHSLPNESRIVALVSIFLHVHPSGASIEYIRSYLKCVSQSIRSSELEGLLERHAEIFTLRTVGVGAGMERKWAFNGYETGHPDSD